MKGKKESMLPIQIQSMLAIKEGLVEIFFGHFVKVVCKQNLVGIMRVQAACYQFRSKACWQSRRDL